jgi:hypothetical protein
VVRTVVAVGLTGPFGLEGATPGDAHRPNWRSKFRAQAAVEKEMFEGQTRATFVPLPRSIWQFSTGLGGSEIASEEV